ncbi:DUF3761 domain-containing protein [Herbaspirillum sp. RTI4]|uniref:DUF3761 domain-containing protein n=1 Tax=Herbaspirillum sp. RTI4 TaxID=3048640 RepID=UPI003A0FC801
MKNLLAGFLFLLLCFPVLSHAVGSSEPDEGQLSSHGHYINKSGQSVHSPSNSTDGKVPVGASAQCRDGSYSFSKHHSGTCSGHHGVAQWLP